jgi:3-oxoadipate enol-lactonase
MKEATATFLGNWFPKTMVAANAPIVRQFRKMLLSISRQGLAGLFAAVRDADMRRTSALIQSPMLVIAGEFDTVTSHAMGEAIANTIPGARLKTFPSVHFSNIEFAQAFNEEVVAFLTQEST